MMPNGAQQPCQEQVAKNQVNVANKLGTYTCVYMFICKEGNRWCVCSSSVVHSALYTKSKVLIGTLLTLLSRRSVRGRASDGQAYTSVPF